jgi:regulatory protein
VLECALRFLAYRARSAAEVHDHLMSRGYSAAAAGAALEKLHSLRYLDDKSFAHDWAAARFVSRGYGPRKIEQELHAKGISDAVIRDVLREICGPPSEEKRARRLLERKFDSENLADPKVARRAAGFLQRRGYTLPVIGAVLKYPAQDD